MRNLQVRLHKAETDLTAKFICNYKSRRAHVRACDEFNLSNECWSTWCGWSYGLATFTRHVSVPKDFNQCLRCLRRQVAQQPATSQPPELHLSSPDISTVHSDSEQHGDDDPDLAAASC